MIGLQTFAGTAEEHNSALKEYHGLLHIRKLPRLNSLQHPIPEAFDLGFKLRRKTFVIEKLHLPPELSETVSRGDEDAPGLCQPNRTKPDPLDF